jgi:lipopolysaccharide/colanic/teichoic acid biosynthesis glycosyltransferase
MSKNRSKKKKRKVLKSAKDIRAERIVYAVIAALFLVAILISYRLSKGNGTFNIYKNSNINKTEKEK